MKIKSLNNYKTTHKDRNMKLASLISFLLQSDISNSSIDNMPLERIYEAKTLLNNIILESNIILDEITNYLSTNKY